MNDNGGWIKLLIMMDLILTKKRITIKDNLESKGLTRKSYNIINWIEKNIMHLINI